MARHDVTISTMVCVPLPWPAKRPKAIPLFLVWTRSKKFCMTVKEWWRAKDCIIRYFVYWSIVMTISATMVQMRYFLLLSASIMIRLWLLDDLCTTMAQCWTVLIVAYALTVFPAPLALAGGGSWDGKVKAFQSGIKNKVGVLRLLNQGNLWDNEEVFQ